MRLTFNSKEREGVVLKFQSSVDVIMLLKLVSEEGYLYSQQNKMWRKKEIAFGLDHVMIMPWSCYDQLCDGIKY